MTIVSSETLHASCVAVNGRAVLIEGLPGSGKSDLALRLIDRGAKLVSDDYTFLRRDTGHALAGPPPNIAGLIEVRGIGLVPMPFETDVPVALIVSIGGDVERLPVEGRSRMIVGVDVPNIGLAPLEASAPIKVELALKSLSDV